MVTKAETTLNLHQRILAIMRDVERIPKRGKNAFHGYTYATEADVEDAVRAALITHGVTMLPILESLTERAITTRSGEAMVVTARVTYRLTNADDPADTLTVTVAGSGQDAGDKAAMKAMTAASKYAALKAFHLPTGDDPEADATTDHNPGVTVADVQATFPGSVEMAGPMVAKLRELCAATNTEVSLVCGHYSVETLDDLTAAQAQEAHAKLTAKLKKGKKG